MTYRGNAVNPFKLLPSPSHLQLELELRAKDAWPSEGAVLILLPRGISHLFSLATEESKPPPIPIQVTSLLLSSNGQANKPQIRHLRTEQASSMPLSCLLARTSIKSTATIFKSTKSMGARGRAPPKTYLYV
jgi:hypothetical protein